ncbi:hypothetical protein ACJ73_02722 [Blastomyces percursus]|uniref:Uncharacterized protein n=1 Tax=Blastomyces percursus TaxID=1658174 RepID=A0A1J9RD24_9EURO|nr:hypothetical protein ACJ73_02722 [Blastomyces percursus]
MSSQPPGISSLCRKYIPTLLLVSNVVLVNSGGFAAAKSILPGYAHGQSVPVSCLNRDIETGEHITDPAGNLQYIPFPTCNETSAPLAFRYGISETITCTIHSLSDTLYHLFEYYVHSDVPLTCRIPTFPLLTSSARSGTSNGNHDNDRNGDSSGEETHDDSTTNDISSSAFQPPFTPLTIALQGTLQLSHLHIWTDMNVLMHQSARLSADPEPYSKKWKKSKKDKKKGKKGDNNMKNNDNNNINKKMNKLTLLQGQIVAASAYSVPMVISATADDNFNDNDGDHGNEAATFKKRKKEREMLMEPWTAEGGAKVIRGEPLVFTFRVGWVSSGDVLGLVQSDKAKWKSTKAFGSGARGGLFFRLMTICFWVGVGMGLAVVVEKVKHRRRVVSVYKGDGILGHRPFFSGFGAGIGGNGAMSFGGDKGRINGYGLGLNGNGNGGGYGGYGGYSGGKKD